MSRLLMLRSFIMTSDSLLTNEKLTIKINITSISVEASRVSDSNIFEILSEYKISVRTSEKIDDKLTLFRLNILRKTKHNQKEKQHLNK